MNKNNHLKQKALEFRNQGMALPEICRRLNKSKTTVYYWIKDLPNFKRLTVTDKLTVARKAASIANSTKNKKLRDAAYEQGKLIYQMNINDALFRDFITIYLTEGYRKNQNAVAVANCNPIIIRVAQNIMKKFSARKLQYVVHFYDDHDQQELTDYWCAQLDIGASQLSFQTKSGAGKLAGRSAVSKYGTMHIRTSDTYLRAKIQAWMDGLEADWRKRLMNWSE